MRTSTTYTRIAREEVTTREINVLTPREIRDLTTRNVSLAPIASSVSYALNSVGGAINLLNTSMENISHILEVTTSSAYNQVDALNEIGNILSSLEVTTSSAYNQVGSILNPTSSAYNQVDALNEMGNILSSLEVTTSSACNPVGVILNPASAAEARDLLYEISNLRRISSGMTPFQEAVESFSKTHNLKPTKIINKPHEDSKGIVEKDVTKEDFDYSSLLNPKPLKSIKSMLEEVAVLQCKVLASKCSASSGNIEHHDALIMKLFRDIVAHSSEALPAFDSILKSLERRNMEEEVAQFEKDREVINKELPKDAVELEEIVNILELSYEEIKDKSKYREELTEFFTLMKKMVEVELALPTEHLLVGDIPESNPDDLAPLGKVEDPDTEL